MPIFMDRHDVPGVTAEDVANAHKEDLLIQDEFNCRALTYWFDEEKGMAFCLIEAPDEKAVQEMHDYAHGLIPNQIIEVEPHIVESFLGRIKDPEDVEKSEFPVIKDPAFRSIVVIYPNENACLHEKDSKGIPGKFRYETESFIRDEIEKHRGKEVELLDQNFIIASFASVTQSVLCALSLGQISKPKQDASEFRIGVSSGVPVSRGHGFFGETINLALRLASTAPPGHIMFASKFSELHRQKFSDRLAENDSSVVVLNQSEEKLFNSVLDVLEKRACDANFDVRVFAERMGMSKSRLYRKLIPIFGRSPIDLIKEYRLRNAFKLITQQHGNISEIAYDSGFSSLSYFSKCFLERFSISPSGLADSLRYCNEIR